MEVFDIWLLFFGSWCSWNFPGPFRIMTKANHPCPFHMFIFIVIRPSKYLTRFVYHALLVIVVLMHYAYNLSFVTFSSLFCHLAWFITSHSKLIIYLYRHPSIYIWFRFFCMSTNGCPMKLFRFCKCCGRCASQRYF